MDLIPTHILDGTPLVQRQDSTGRVYYTDLQGHRAATAGKSPEPYGAPIAAKEPTEIESTISALSAQESEVETEPEGTGIVDGPLGENPLADTPDAPLEPEPVPEEWDLEEFMVVMTAISPRCPGGRFDHGPYTAITENNGEVMFCRPSASGGQERFMITLPETIKLQARRV